MANKDLIIKLAKLANNNPSEHEANAAARKVCQLLAENSFSMLSGLTRTTEPDFKSTVVSTPYGTGPFGEWFRKWEEEVFKNTNVEYNPFTSPIRGGKKEKESRMRTCTKCGCEVNTYRIKEDPFICQVCHWS